MLVTGLFKVAREIMRDKSWLPTVAVRRPLKERKGTRPENIKKLNTPEMDDEFRKLLLRRMPTGNPRLGKRLGVVSAICGGLFVISYGVLGLHTDLLFNPYVVALWMTPLFIAANGCGIFSGILTHGEDQVGMLSIVLLYVSMVFLVLGI